MADGKISQAADHRDELFTLLSDIETYLLKYKNLFTGKTIICNCDDPFESSFFKFFLHNFNVSALKKLITVSRADSPLSGKELPVFEMVNRQKIKKAYKIEVVETASLQDDYIAILGTAGTLLASDKNQFTLLKGDGDFRSNECIELLKEADIAVTFPPHSIFQEYVKLLMQYEKKFLLIGSKDEINSPIVSAWIKEKQMRIDSSFKNSETVCFTNLEI